MKGAPTSFWAKLHVDDNGRVHAWHPFIDHCADVAAVFEALLRLATLRKRLATLAGRSDFHPVTLARLCVLVALHDLGKANLGFQAKGRPELGATAGHVGEAIALISTGRPDVRRVLDAEILLSWGDAAAHLLISSICHHGRPHAKDAPAFEESWWRPCAGLDPLAEIASLMSHAWQWFPKALDEGPMLPSSVAFQHAFAGLVMLADWIGSDRDERMFPFSESGDPERIDFARRRARSALRALGLNVECARSVVSDKSPFDAIAPGLQPRPAQEALLQLEIPSEGSVTVLESETGSGKTEAAIARFISLFGAGCVDGMVFALPTRTAATQIFERVLHAMTQAFPNTRMRPPVILAVPGYLRVDNQVGRRLAPFDVLWPDAPGERERHRGWAAERPKRFLAGPVVVGTIDQVLLSGLMVSHAHLRAVALLRQLLVVDEVHASDAYMSRILGTVLARQLRAGGHALLLSATLAGETRARLLDAEPPSFNEAMEASYPLVSATVGNCLVADAVQHEGRQREIFVEEHPCMEEPSRVAHLAVKKAALGAKVVVLRNTVADCLATQRAVEEAADDPTILFSCGGVLSPHHSRYARADRGALDGELEARLGRARPDGGCVVVATQTVQQSLDLDADFLITDLCPVDVLLQRIGRLHRHQRERPGGFERARVVVLVPDERDLGIRIQANGHAGWRFGIGTVYPDLRMLEATWQLIRRRTVWTIPSECRSLVEEGLHSEALSRIVEEGGEAWRRHAAVVWGERFGEQRLANLNVVDWETPYAEMLFPSDRKIPSRLGEGDRRVVFQRAVASPFGNLVRELTIMASWAGDVPPDVCEARNLVEEGGSVRFVYGARAYVYDRLGLRPETPAGPERLEDDDDEA